MDSSRTFGSLQCNRKAMPLVMPVLAVTAAFLLGACSANNLSTTASKPSQSFIQSGTIILSKKVPARLPVQSASSASRPVATLMAPLIGYFPPAAGYVPANNEAWLEIKAENGLLTVYRGKTPVKTLQAEGNVSIAPGEYFLRHKQKEPVWYAPDSYFAKRQLHTPADSDSIRFRRGALGTFAIYPTAQFPIHCGQIWSDEVGGLRLEEDELASIYYMLPVGAPVVVR